jgi:hypothetical protein
MFNLQDNIPSYKIVEITGADNSSVTGNIPLILKDELSIKVSSKYGELWEASPNNFMSLLSSSFGLPSGQFALQGVQIWQSTDPIDLSITVSLEMDTDPYNDVIAPTVALMSTVLPTKGSMGEKSQIGGLGFFQKAISNLKLKTLIPPGPNLQAIWSTISNEDMTDAIGKALAHFDKGKNGVYNVKIGYAYFNNVIIKNVEPSFSSEMSYSRSQRNYYPSSASLSLEMMTMEVATTDMMNNIFTNRG